MEIRPLQREHYELILPWFDEVETQRRLDGLYPLPAYLKLIKDSPDKHVWSVWKSETTVGLIELEVESDVAYPMILVAPAARGQGFGHKIVTQLILLASQLNVKEIEAGVAVDNIASGKCFERAGFEVREEVDGFNYYVLGLPAISPEE